MRKLRYLCSDCRDKALGLAQGMEPEVLTIHTELPCDVCGKAQELTQDGWTVSVYWGLQLA